MNPTPVVIYAPGVEVLWMFRDGLRDCNLIEGKDFELNLEWNKIPSRILPNKSQMFVTNVQPIVYSCIGGMVSALRELNPKLVTVSFGKREIKDVFDHSLLDDQTLMNSVRFEKLAILIRNFLTTSAQ